jgi:hypothetical protein
VRFVSAFAAEGLKHSGRAHELLLTSLSDIRSIVVR